MEKTPRNMEQAMLSIQLEGRYTNAKKAKNKSNEYNSNEQQDLTGNGQDIMKGEQITGGIIQ